MKQFATSAITLAICLFAQSVVQAQTGMWNQFKTQIPLSSCGPMVISTDGTILVSEASIFTGFQGSARWARLTPDRNGNYVNGTWELLAEMNFSRAAFVMQMLPNGKVWVMGGEYSSDPTNFLTNTGEIYDPVLNKWHFIRSFPQPYYGDDPCSILPNGKILCGYIFSTDTYLYDIANDSWSRTGIKLHNDRSDEETWVKLPDGSILSYDIFNSIDNKTSTAQRYVPSTGRWVTTPAVPVVLSTAASGYEIGPALLLPNQTVLNLGSGGQTAFYFPSSDTWKAGPSLPGKYACEDGPAAMMPNGHVLFLADIVPLGSPTKIFDFDPTTNAITDVTPASGTLASDLQFAIAQQYVMAIAPNGHILLSSGTGKIWDYTPTGTPDPSWAPAITSYSLESGTTYRLTGKQLNGISEGVSFGDEANAPSNYPIVRFTNAKGAVWYAKTVNWTPGLVAKDITTTCEFTLPTGLPFDTYQLQVIANGIPSAAKTFVLGTPIPASNVDAVFDSGSQTLTLTGDANANSVSVTYQAGTITVQGANQTSINKAKTPSNSLTFSFTGSLNISANLGAGNDALSLVGINGNNVNVVLGPNTLATGTDNDTLGVILSTISNLTVNGGAGTDVVTTTSSSFAHKPVLTNVP